MKRSLRRVYKILRGGDRVWCGANAKRAYAGTTTVGLRVLREMEDLGYVETCSTGTEFSDTHWHLTPASGNDPKLTGEKGGVVGYFLRGESNDDRSPIVGPFSSVRLVYEEIRTADGAVVARRADRGWLFEEAYRVDDNSGYGWPSVSIWSWPVPQGTAFLVE